MNFLSPLTTIILAFTTPAFATHAYHHETCRSATHTMQYDGDAGYSDSYSLSKIGSTHSIKIWQNEENTPAIRNEFKTIYSKTLSAKKIMADCGPDSDIEFESDVTTSRSVYKFTILKDDEAMIGIKMGSLIKFTCKTTNSYPVQCNPSPNRFYYY